jgi:hypothetical protein
MTDQPDVKKFANDQIKLIEQQIVSDQIKAFNDGYKEATKEALASAEENIPDIIFNAVQKTAQQCYLECIREEQGEGQCAETIRTKFNLPKRDGEWQ